jgi:hypothetical protein
MCVVRREKKKVTPASMLTKISFASILGLWTKIV